MNRTAITKNQSFYFWLLMGLILIVLLIRIGYLAADVWPFNGDEAQYWDWSKHLAFGYYSKPPMIAWIIAITTHIFGNGLIGIRIGSPIMHTGTAIVLYFIGSQLYNNRIGFWSGLTYILLPGVSFSSNIISTDPILIFFWSIALLGFTQAIFKNKTWGWYLCGIALGFATLSKYAGLFFPLSMFLYLATSKPNRHYLASIYPYLSLLIAFIILIPNIIWNIDHQFVSVSAVSANAAISGIHFHIGNWLNFMGAQFAIFGPILFGLLIVMLFRWRKVTSDPRQYYLLLFTIPLLIIMSVEALISHAHGNWAAPMFVSACVAVVAFVIEEDGLRWILAGLILNILLFTGVFYLENIIDYFHIKMPAHTSALDWNKAGKEINAIYKQHSNSYLLVDNRMLLTKTMYYAHIPLSKTVKWNPSGIITDQYDMVTNMKTHIGDNFILVTYNYNPTGIFKDFKSEVEVKDIKLPTLGDRSVDVYVYYLQDFKGYNS